MLIRVDSDELVAKPTAATFFHHPKPFGFSKGFHLNERKSTSGVSHHHTRCIASHPVFQVNPSKTTNQRQHGLLQQQEIMSNTMVIHLFWKKTNPKTDPEKKQRVRKRKRLRKKTPRTWCVPATNVWDPKAVIKWRNIVGTLDWIWRKRRKVFEGEKNQEMAGWESFQIWGVEAEVGTWNQQKIDWN